jgi:hypothetical protein
MSEFKGYKISESQLRRVCRMYHTNTAAAQALGVHRDRLEKLCDQLGIEKPSDRKKSRRKYDIS